MTALSKNNTGLSPLCKGLSGVMFSAAALGFVLLAYNASKKETAIREAAPPNLHAVISVCGFEGDAKAAVEKGLRMNNLNRVAAMLATQTASKTKLNSVCDKLVLFSKLDTEMHHTAGEAEMWRAGLNMMEAELAQTSPGLVFHAE